MSTVSSAAPQVLVRPAAPEDLAALRDFDGFELAPARPEEAVWVALLGGSSAACASLRLRRRIGQPLPAAWFRLGWAVHASAELKLYGRQRTLMLCHDLVGADALTGWGMAPDLGAPSALAVWTALLATALDAHAPAAGDVPGCIAELPGLRGADGGSPVWDGLGRHFFELDLARARAQHGAEWTHHVASLLPRQLVYASFLPPDAQDALGRTHAGAAALVDALKSHGFEPRDHVALTDAGAVFERP